MGVRCRGFASDGCKAYAPIRHSPLFIADVITQLQADRCDPDIDVPLSEGVDFVRSKTNQLQLLLDDALSRRHRRLFGYVGEI